MKIYKLLSLCLALAVISIAPIYAQSVPDNTGNTTQNSGPNLGGLKGVSNVIESVDDSYCYVGSGTDTFTAPPELPDNSLGYTWTILNENGDDITALCLTVTGSGPTATYTFDPTKVPATGPLASLDQYLTVRCFENADTSSPSTLEDQTWVNSVPNNTYILSSASTDYCPNSNITISLSGSQDNTYAYSLYRDGTTLVRFRSGTGGAISFIPFIQPAGTTSVYTVVASKQGCTATMLSTLTITTYPLIQVDPILPATCLGGSVEFDSNVTSPGTFDYDWKFGGVTISTAPKPSFSPVTLAMEGIYTLTVTDLVTNCTRSVSRNFDVYPLPSPMPTANTPVCEGDILSLSGAPGGLSDYDWTGPNGFVANNTQSPSINPVAEINQGDYYLTVEDVNGCKNTAMVTVVVDPTPVITPMTTAICSGLPFSVTPVNGVNGIVPVGTTYSWAAPTLPAGLSGGATGTDEANVFGTLTNSTNGALNATYTVIPKTGNCTGDPFTVTVTVNPGASINNITTTTCTGIGFVVTPTNGVDGVVPSGTTYSWGLPVVTGGMTGGATGTGAANISATFVNTTNIAQTATYTVTPSAGSCVGATFTVVVTVNPKPSITPMTATACSTIGFTVTPTDGVNGVVPAGTTYSWPLPVVTGGLTGGAIGSGAVSITGTLTNPTNVAQTATYTVTPICNGCTGSTFTVIVTINPRPTINNYTTAVCSGTLFSVTPADGINGVVPAGTTYSWGLPVVTGGITGGATATGVASITGTLTNPTNVNQTATYTVTPSSGGCVGTPFTLVVTVNPSPVINLMATSVCSGSPFTVTPTNGVDGIVPAGTLYSWGLPVVTGGITGGATGSNAANISGTLTNPTNVAQTATYTITPTIGGCTGVPFSLVVTVNPKPAVTNMTATICSGLPFTVTPANGVNGIVPAGTTYSWGVPTVTGGLTGGVAGSGATDITGTLINSTNIAQTATYTVTPSVAGCTGSTFTVIVTVNPGATINNMTASVCSGLPFSVTPVNGTNGVIPAGTTYTWGLPVVTGGVTGGAAGNNAAAISGTLTNPTNLSQTATYTVTPSSGTCSGLPFTVVVTVNPTPAITPMSASVCSGNAFSLTPTNGVNGVVPAGTTYSWGLPVVTGGLTGGAIGSNVATISGTLTNPTNIVQTATYTVTPSVGGCGGASFTVTITVNPKPTISNINSTICSGSPFTVTPTNGVNGVVPVGTTYSWGLPVVTGGMTGGTTGTAQASISNTLINSTSLTQTATYTVTPSVGGCDGTPFTVVIGVSPSPAITDMATSICSGNLFTVVPTNGTDGIVPAGTTYSWGVPVVTGGITGGASGTNVATISGTLVNPTTTSQTATYTVTPRLGTCTGATFTVVVTVNPKPAVNNLTGLICSGILFTITPTNGFDGIIPAGTTYSWGLPVVTGGITGGATGTNEANIFGTLTNPTNTSQTATYTVTPSVGGCAGSTFTVIVTVNPGATINNMTTSVCSGLPFNVTPTNGTNGIVPAGTTYTWGLPVVTGGMTGGAPGTNLASISGTLINSTNLSQTATYTVTPSSGSCSGLPFTVVVTVNPTPAITPIATTICSGLPFSITPTNGVDGVVPAGTTYSWGLPVVTGGLTGGAIGSNLSTISGTLINPTNAVQTATYTVTPSISGCSGATFTVTVTVNPGPAISNMTSTVCSNNLFTVTPVNGVNGVVPVGTTYTWALPVVTGGMTGGTTGTAQASISNTLVNSTNVAQTATYTVTPSSGSCSGATFTVVVTVNPSPVITPISANICSGLPFDVTPINGTDGIVPAGTTYSWGIPVVTGGLTGGVAGSGATINGTLNNPTTVSQTATYTVTPSLGSCVGATFTVVVTVNSKPSVSNMISTTCSGLPFTVTPTNGVDGLVPAGTTYSWGLPVVTGGLTGGAIGAGATNISGTLVNPTNTTQTATYTVTPSSGGCSGSTFTVIVTVNPGATINNITTSVCSGLPFSVNPVNGADGIVPAGTTYTWGLPVVTGGMTGGAAGNNAASISGTLLNSTNSSQTATYTVTPRSGSCTGATFTVVVTVNPAPSITPMTASVCSGLSFSVTPINGVDGVVPAGTTYSWGLPVVTGGITGGAVGSNLATISGTLVNPTNAVQTATYTVTPSISGCSGATFTVTITVNPGFAINNMTTSVCSGLPFSVTPANGVDGLVPVGTTYSWGLPVVTGGITGGAVGTNQASISNTLINPTNVAQTATYTVTPSAGGCNGATFTVVVTVNPSPVITNITSSVCNATLFTVSPTNGVDGIVPAGTTYSWGVPVVTGGLTGGASGTGASDISGTLTNSTNTTQTATYTVTPTVGGCVGTTFTVIVTVNPEPVVSPMSTSICSGIAFSLSPTDGVDGVVPVGTTYSWGLPVVTGGLTGGAIGSNVNTISGTLVNSTNVNQTATYTVTPTINGCNGAPFIVTITVTPGAVINNITTSVCSNTLFSVSPSNGVDGIVPAGTTYSWSSPIVTGGMTGGVAGVNELTISGTLVNSTNSPQTATYTVTPTSGVCDGPTFTVVVTVNPSPSINPINSSTCSNTLFDVTPINVTDGIVPMGTTYSWSVPIVTGGLTGGSSGVNQVSISGTLVNPTTVAQTATFTVTPTYSGCIGADFTLVVTVNPAPAINNLVGTSCSNDLFTITPIDGVDGLVPVGTTYTWGVPSVTGGLTGGVAGSGSSITGTIVNSSTVAETATYTVTPSLAGCDGAPFDVVVTINPLPSAITGNTTICVGSKSTLSSTTAGGTWSSSNLAVATVDLNTGEVTAVSAGSSTIRYTLTSTTGCYIETTFTVNDLPTITATNDGPKCEGEDVQLTATSTGTVTYSWVGPNGFTSTDQNPLLSNVTILNDAGAYTLTVNAGVGCDAIASTIVDINPLPTVDLGPDQPVCSGSSITIGIPAQAGFSYLWSSGEITSEITVSPATDITYTLTVTNDATLCQASDDITLTVDVVTAVLNLTSPVPGNHHICLGQTAIFAASGNGIAPLNFEFFEDGVSKQGPGTQTIYSTPILGDVTVSVTVTDDAGCSATDSWNVIADPIPTVSLQITSAGGNTVCAGAPVDLLADSPVMYSSYTFYMNGIIIYSGPSNTLTGITTLPDGAELYVVASNGCQAQSNSIFVNVLPLPTPTITVTPSTDVCTGSNVTLTAGGGVNYQFVVDGVPVGPFSNVDTYVINNMTSTTVVSVNVEGANGCGSASTSETVTVHPYPTDVNVLSSSATYCEGTNGVSIYLESSEAGYSYELFDASNATQGIILADGVTTVIWNNLKAGDYHVTATGPAPANCASTLTDVVTISEIALPIVYDMTPNGNVSGCNGGAGWTLSLNNSQVGVNYTLLLNGNPIGGSLIAGTGAAISFAPQFTFGTYTVLADNGSCTVPMNNSLNVALDAAGTLFSLSSVPADGRYCVGSAGVQMHMNGSEVGVNYILRRDVSTVVETFVGTGAAFDFVGFQTIEGVYTVGIQTAGGCTLDMVNSVTVQAVPMPIAYDVVTDNSGFYCESAAGVTIHVTNQEVGVDYQLKYNGVVIQTVTGTLPGADLYFTGTFTQEGVYSVDAVVPGVGCTTPMNNTITVTQNLLPVAYAVTTDGDYCQGGSTNITLANSEVDAQYRWFNLDDSSFGSWVTGTGSALVFPINQVGNYQIQSERTANGITCSNLMNGTVAINSKPLPIDVTHSETGGTGCNDGVVITIQASEVGVVYSLVNRTTSIPLSGYSVTGNGSDISFAPIVDNNTFYILATLNGCTKEMPIDVTVTIPGAIVKQTVTGSGSLCSGDLSGLVFGLASTEVGVVYTLYLADAPGALTGTNVAQLLGDGTSRSFPTQTVAGEYYVIGDNASGTCPNEMTNRVSLIYNAIPTATLTADAGIDACVGAPLSFTAGGGSEYLFYINNVAQGAWSSVNTFTSTFADGDELSVKVRTGIGCDATSSVLTITVHNGPVAQAVLSSATAYCTGDPGVTIYLGASEAGVTYELFNSIGTSIGTVVADGVSLVQWSGLLAETYYVVATGALPTFCQSNMANSVVIIENALPAEQFMFLTGNQNGCNNGIGYEIKIVNSQAGVSYQLLLNGNVFGAPKVSTADGSEVSFGNHITFGTYTIIATNASGCSKLFDSPGNSITLLSNIPADQIFTIQSIPSPATICAGGSAEISLSGSTTGTNYTLMKDGINYIPLTVVTGTGSSFIYGSYNEEGAYTSYFVTAEGCNQPMNGVVNIDVLDQPLAYALLATNNGQFCIGTAGVQFSIAGQELGMEYILSRDGVDLETIVGVVTNPTVALAFTGTYNTIGVYSVRARVASTSCTTPMANTISLTEVALPLVKTITTSGDYCAGSFADIYVDDSELNIIYTLYKDGVNTTITKVGTGGRVSFQVSVAGIYTVKAATSIGCEADMTGSLDIKEKPQAEDVGYSVSGGSSCSDPVVVTLNSNHQTGVIYTLVNKITGVPSTISVVGTGDGAILQFPGIIDNGATYVIQATLDGCSHIMPGADILVNIVGAVTKHTVTPLDGNICDGDLGIQFGLSSSNVGTLYELRLVDAAGDIVIDTKAGTGTFITFDILGEEEGDYYVMGINSSDATCNNEMTNRVKLVVNPLPISYQLIGSGYYCDDALGAEIKVSDSQEGYTYILQFTNGTGPKRKKATIVAGAGGGELSFGRWTELGNYSVIARTPLGCTSTMNTIINVQKAAAPLKVDLTYNPVYCSNTTGTELFMSEAQVDITYKVVDNSGVVLKELIGDGSLNVSLGIYPVGIYSVIAYVGGDACETYVNTTPINIDLGVLPLVYDVSLKTTEIVLSGKTGSHIYLLGSETDVTYTLVKDAILNVGQITATASSDVLDFGQIDDEGNYTIIASNGSGCNLQMNGIASLGKQSFDFEAINDTLYVVKDEYEGFILVNRGDGVNDITNPTIDVDMKYTLITQWLTEKGEFNTIGGVKLDSKTGKLTYTKLPNFFGLDSVKYEIANQDPAHLDRKDVATVFIVVPNVDDPLDGFVIPNAFSPNADGYNDYFVIAGIQHLSTSYLEIYNRWGTLVYRSEGQKYDNKWDGRGNANAMVSIGDDLPNGTYYYIFKVSIVVDGEKKSSDYNGFIELRR